MHMDEQKEKLNEEPVLEKNSDKKHPHDASIQELEDYPVMEAEEELIDRENKRGLARGKFKRSYHKVFTIVDDMASHETIREKMIDGARITGINSLILLCAIIIASIGLHQNAVAVIIGAMLISPLMGTIMGAAYGTVAADRKVVFKSLSGFLIQVGISLTVSTLFFLITPSPTNLDQLLARTKPNYFDVVIAFVGGTAGALASTRKSEYSNVIPGVAIATALMPPLCTCGWALAYGKWNELFGALYLFVINGYFIYLSTVIMLVLMATPKVKELTMRQWRRIRNRIFITTLITLVPFIVLAVIKILQMNGVLPPVLPQNDSSALINTISIIFY